MRTAEDVIVDRAWEAFRSGDYRYQFAISITANKACQISDADEAIGVVFREAYRMGLRATEVTSD